ncbi:DAK2 domain-containing protein [Alkalibacter mobilis]|uniref:DAK2 domain-containing protein n=1 Tax=Alkalibacter mobilis TaxID=2787712 RepID=UPI00189ECE1B|nr:DegV family protein [Alkalibacter mobilis]MBF7097393.1 DegV family EDD domain-containing protein [Alkalibacter mobilis]
MRFSKLSGENIYHLFVSGANEVISQKQNLNDINVFPVPDGDTGNNLASTMVTIIEEAKIEKSASDTFKSIADAALVGARGNSGIIFAQYLNGISKNLTNEDELTIGSFTESAKKAVPQAYSAISNPVEGTMITVIREWADHMYSIRESAGDFSELLSISLETAIKSLQETTEKLKVLKDAAVVDSGAKGFVHFVEGFVKFLKTGIVEKLMLQDEHPLLLGEHPSSIHENFNFRYCTEGLILKNNIDQDIEEIKNELKQMGDSLIVAGNDTKIRIHIHTNDPSKVFMSLRNYGKILQQKADDMKNQYDAIYNRKYSVALVTDSIADIPRDVMDKYQISMIPLNLMIEDSAYLDKMTITSETFYKLLDEIDEYPTSSQPNLKVVENILGNLIQNYDSAIVITVAKPLSGTYQTILNAAKKFNENEKRIHVIDSKQNSGAQGLLVLKAAELIDSGLSVAKVVESIESHIKKTKIFVSVTTLKYMVRSGRVNKVTGLAARALNLKPVISLDDSGMGTILDKAFSLKGNTSKIEKRVKEFKGKNGNLRFAVIHAGAEERADEYRKRFSKLLGSEPEYVMNISPIVAMSAGIGCVAVAIMADE